VDGWTALPLLYISDSLTQTGVYESFVHESVCSGWTVCLWFTKKKCFI